jgi:hypothetical protein
LGLAPQTPSTCTTLGSWNLELRMYVVVCAKAQHIRSSVPATCAFSLFKGKERRSGSGSGVGTPLRGGRRKPPRRSHPRIHRPSRLGQGKGRRVSAPFDPCSSLVYSVARRVNSVVGERVGLDLRKRRPRRPVVTDSYIDSTTRTERTSFALRPRLRRRSRAAARPSACADTRAPSACFHAQAC